MKYKILLITLIAALGVGCNSAYRSTQTPDDVYYSPVRPMGEEESKTDEEDKRYSQEDRQIRMSRHDRRWREFDDDYDCRYDPYHYGYSYGYYYNPYYYPYPVFFSSPVKNPKNSTPRMTNLSSYQYQTITTTNPKTGVTETSVRGRRYNLGNSGRERRETITPSTDNNRSYTPSSGTRSTGTPVSRPARGG